MNETDPKTSIDETGQTSIYDTLGYVLSFFNFCTGLVAIGLNLFVIYILLIKRGFSRVHNSDVFVVGLTFTDLLTGIVLIGSILTVYIENGRIFCLFQICFIQSSMLCSALFVTLMTSDRYFKIVHPFRYQRACSVEFCPFAISAAVYVFAFFVGFLPLLGPGAVKESENPDWVKCNYLQVLKPGFRITYVGVMAIPIPTAILLYAKIFKVAKFHIKSIAKTQGVSSKVPRGRYIKMIFVIAGLYFIFYIPPALFSMLHATNQLMVDSNVKSKTIFHFCAAGIITNPIANAITYAYTIPLVKNTFRNVVGLPVELHMSMESSGSRKVRTPRLLSETGNTLRVKRKRKKTIEHKAMEGIQDTIGEQTMSIKRHTHHMSKKRKKHKRKRHSSKVANGQLPDKGEGSQNVNSTRESRKVSSTEARNGNSLDESLHLQQQNLSNEKAAETVGETGFQYDTVLSSHHSDTRE